MNEPAFSIKVAAWPEDQELLKIIREQVFVNEQQVPRDLEWDGLDADALHLLALDADKNPIGCVRLLPTGQIGRMAVIEPWRNKGLGKALLERLFEEIAHATYPPLFLKAQLTAMPFYAKHGFTAEGDDFMDAGIPHRLMKRDTAEHPSAQAGLDETDEILYLHAVDEHRQLTSRMINQAKRSVKILTFDLDPLVYDQPRIITVMKQFVLRNHLTQVQILLQDNNLVRNQGHRLTDLAQRLPSSIEIRKPDKDAPQLQESFLLIDSRGYILRKPSGRYAATACLNDPLMATRLEESFDEIWESAAPDRELSQLCL